MFDQQMLQMLLQQMQGNGATGFMMPGGGMPTPASGAPQLPQAGPRGASAGMTPMPSAPMAGSPSGGGAMGMFSQMASNPMLMAALMKNQQPPQNPQASASATPAYNAPGMQLPWQSPGQSAPAAPQLPWQQTGLPPQQAGIQGLLARMFGGSGA